MNNVEEIKNQESLAIERPELLRNKRKIQRGIARKLRGKKKYGFK